MQTNMIKQKEGEVGKLRLIIRLLINLAKTYIGKPIPTATLVSKMNELDQLYNEYLYNCATEWIGFNPPSKAAQTRLANDHRKVMKALAKEIVRELSKIDCSYCGTGNVETTNLCAGRKVGSGFEIKKMQKSRNAPMVKVGRTERQYCYETWEWLEPDWKWEWGKLLLPAQGNCEIGQGPFQGSDRPMHNALEHLDSDSALLILNNLDYDEIPRHVRAQLDHYAYQV